MSTRRIRDHARHRPCYAARVASAAACAAMLLVAFACGSRRAPRAVTPRIGHTERGVASWYGHPYHGRRAANGEIFDMEKLTAAHRTFAFGTWVRVHNLDNGKTIDVRITDRGPFVRGRIIDLSRAAAREIEMIGPGLAKVRLEVIQRPAEPQAITAGNDPRVALEKFAVQVGAFRDRAAAERRRRQFDKPDRPARLIRRDGSPPLWRVLVGEFEQIEDAEALAIAIRTDGVDALTVRLDDSSPGNP